MTIPAVAIQQTFLESFLGGRVTVDTDCGVWASAGAAALEKAWNSHGGVESMNRMNWALVLVPLAVLGLMACQNAAFGQDSDLPLAPMPAGFEVALAPPVATAPAVPSVTATVPGAACEEGCGCGCGCCCDRHWIVSVEGLWLAPIGNQRTATYTIDGDTYSAAAEARDHAEHVAAGHPRLARRVLGRPGPLLANGANRATA